MNSSFPIGPLALSPDRPFVIAGPCVIESEAHVLRMAEALVSRARAAGFGLIFKASYDKANRTSGDSYRGPGIREGLRILARVRDEFGVPILSDVHETAEVAVAAETLDVLQIPAFLCRQTDLIEAAARSGRVINVKKGQFLAPWDMEHVVAKAREAGCERLILTERGASFGYNNLVADMRSLVEMAKFGCPVVFDATHSVQTPGGLGGKSGGRREFVEPLIRAAVAVGVDGVFMEVHDDPDRALSDGPNQLPLERFAPVLETIRRIDGARRASG